MRVRGMQRALVTGAALALALAACGTDSGEGDDPAATEVDSATDGTEPADDGETAADGATSDEGSGEPIVIGALTSLTGPFTPWGVQTLAGMEMAAEEINAEGGVDGRMIEIVQADDQNDPDLAVTEMERMVEQDGAVAIGGVISSSVGVVGAEAAEDLEVPLFMVKAGSAEVLTADSQYTFRTCLPAAPMTAPPLVQYVEEEGFTKVGVIVAAYAWGESIQASLEEAFAGSDVEVQFESAPVEETDFTTYLRALQDFEPDVIAATGHPPGAGPITVQAADLGLDVPVTGPYAPLATVVEGVGDVAYDSYADYGCVDFSDAEYQGLATRFAETSEFSFMEADAVAGYGIVQAVAESVAAAGDDPVAVAEHLHGNSFDTEGLAYPLAWTEYGELDGATTVLSIIREQAPPDGVSPGAEWYPEVLSISDPLEPYQPE